MRESIVITGIGLITPLGCAREKTWGYVKMGQSVSAVQNALEFSENLGLYVRTAPFLAPQARHRIFPIALSSAHEALNHAQIDIDDYLPEDIGCSVSVSKPIFQDGIDEPIHAESVGQYLLEKLDIEGPTQNFVAACATGIHSVLAGSRWLQEGLCKIVIAGSCESSLNPLTISGFKNMGVLSKEPKPFDHTRDGFLMGEGAGIVILERKSDALSRGANIIAEISGCAVGSDSTHPTRFKEDGSSVASVVARALKDASLTPDKIDYVNLHGTGTESNDVIETLAVKNIFKDSLKHISFSSTKASTGHLLGAAGSVELGMTCLALRDQFVPPTAGLTNPDPACDLDYTPKRGKSRAMTHAMSLSFGFGGPIGAIIVKKP